MNKQTPEEIADRIMAIHADTCYYDEGDIVGLEKMIVQELRLEQDQNTKLREELKQAQLKWFKDTSELTIELEGLQMELEALKQQ